MDDIALLARSAKELQEISNITSLFLNKWHLKVNIKKSAVMIFRNNIHQSYIQSISNWNSEIKYTKTKYLGEHFTENLTLAYYLMGKECQVESIIQSCIFVSSDMVIANIQMESLFKLYHTVIVAVVYSCETWIKYETDNSKLNQIQISILRRILKLPISTPLVSIYIETGVLPLNLECEKRQLIYLWTLMNKKAQSKDITNMLLSEFSQNKNNLLNYITGLIKKLNIPTAHIDLQSISKGKWKRTVVRHIKKYANNHCVTKGNNLSKLRYLFKHKQEMMKEKSMSKLSKSQALTMFKLCQE